MADAAVTRAEIFDASNALADLGIMPSIILVRDAVGNRGSETTINKYLKEWKLLLLKKNSVGCVFCDTATEENKRLTAEVSKYITIVDQLKASLIVMLENPDRKLAVEEIISLLNNG